MDLKRLEELSKELGGALIFVPNEEIADSISEDIIEEISEIENECIEELQVESDEVIELRDQNFFLNEQVKELQFRIEKYKRTINTLLEN